MTDVTRPEAAARPAALDALSDQPRVRDFLARALAEDCLSHAYLFVGAPGSGKHEAAEALAKCVVCPGGGDCPGRDCADRRCGGSRCGCGGCRNSGQNREDDLT